MSWGEGQKERERERERERGESQADSMLSAERRHRAQSHGPGITTRAKIKSQMLNGLSHPGAPKFLF